MTDSVECRTRSAEETLALGRSLGARAQPGDVFLVRGPMGAGKTTLIQGLAAGAGFSGAVTSPTFALAHEYRGGHVTLVHMDLYRIETVSQAWEIGLADYLDAGAVLAIEWPEAVLEALPSAIVLSLEVLDADARRIVLTGAREQMRASVQSAAEADRAPL